MFLLDTNVVSELRRRDTINPRVCAWIQSVPSTDLFLSAITVFELELGTLLLARRDKPQGDMLRTWIDKQVLPTFARRVLPVDTTVALQSARLHMPDRRPERDALIAATALVHRLRVVTRNVADFAPMQVDVLNPWN